MSVVSRATTRIVVLLLALVGLLAAQGWNAGPAHAAPAPSYDSIPATLPPSWQSLGFQATQTDEFGDLVQLGGIDRELRTITVGFVDWACQIGGGTTCLTAPGATWTYPITIKVYAEGTAPLPGALLATVTQIVTIPYRPSADPVNCGVGATTWFNPGTGTCHNGFGFTSTFDFTSLALVVPNRVIVSVSYNTQSHGATPIGSAGPYNSLNVALASVSPPTVGTDVDTDSMYWDTSTAAWYADGGTAGVGTFRADDTGWADFGLVLEVNTETTLTTLPAPVTPVTPAASLPTLAVTGSEPQPAVGIAGLAAVLVGVVLVAAGSRRRPLHRT